MSLGGMPATPPNQHAGAAPVILQQARRDLRDHAPGDLAQGVQDGHDAVVELNRLVRDGGDALVERAR